jgi:uncharacterized Zn finger protein
VLNLYKGGSMNMKCESCNSEVIVIKKGHKYVAECSYCGKPSDIQVGVDFAEELGEDE